MTAKFILKLFQIVLCYVNTVMYRFSIKHNKIFPILNSRHFKKNAFRCIYKIDSFVHCRFLLNKIGSSIADVAIGNKVPFYFEKKRAAHIKPLYSFQSLQIDSLFHSHGPSLYTLFTNLTKQIFSIIP